MQGSLTSILSWLETLLIFSLNVFVLYWFYRLWKKTEESGFFWLMMSFGASPLLYTAFHRSYRVIVAGFFPSQTVALSHPLHLVHAFLNFVLCCMTFGCLLMGLKQLSKRYTTLQPPCTDSGTDRNGAAS